MSTDTKPEILNSKDDVNVLLVECFFDDNDRVFEIQNNTLGMFDSYALIGSTTSDRIIFN
ncbi:MAG TPA: hypothetical protein VF622_03760 [Segetibacter sp.]